MTSQKLVGVDEVGRGCLAGPVISAAVMLENNIDTSCLKDSKEISPKNRVKLAEYILNNSISVGIGFCSNIIIDKINIHEATLLSMKKSILALSKPPDLILVDGKFSPDVKYKCNTYIKGDKRIPEISAASIVAKVIRDNYMSRIDNVFDAYKFSQHKGYGTKEHIGIIDKLGPSIYHRMSFAPLKDMFR